MSFYEFQKSDAYDFARYIGTETRVERGEELSFRVCPYCRNAERGNQWKFAINLRTGLFNCKRGKCNQKGNMLVLSRDFGFKLNGNVEEYYNPKRKYKTLKTPEKPIESKDPAIRYLQGRGISEATARRYEITTQTKDENVLVFPFYDEKGILTFVKYRRTDFDKKKHNVKEWCEKDTKPILFGMKQCNPESKTLVITEGQIDSLSVAEAGIENAVSVPTGKGGTTWFPYCYDWVNQFQTIIVFGDYENDEITLLDMISKRFKCDVKHVREEDYKGCKDANDILRKYGKEQIRACINNAIHAPVARVKKLSEVADIDIYKIPKLKTGIRQEDILLYGGLPFGYVHIIAGKRGDGKSTLASQIMASALKQKYICFAYSGELLEGNFRAWIEFQLAGRNHIIENTNVDGTPYRFITNSNKDKMRRWYDENIYIYDNSIIEEDEKEDLLKTIDEVIRKYGVQVILIDNLMTAIDLEDSKAPEYDRQAEFVNALRKMAFRYQVLIMLVAHRRKNSGFGADANDEVLGSSKVTNLAGIVLGYDRLTDTEISDGAGTEDDRKLTTTKNRLFGKINPKGYIVRYEELSKRIYGKGDDPDCHYGWEVDDFEETEDSPFT